LQRTGGVPGLALAPQVLGEAVHRHHRSSVHQQVGQQHPDLGLRDQHRTPARGDDLERTEHPEAHSITLTAAVTREATRPTPRRARSERPPRDDPARTNSTKQGRNQMPENTPLRLAVITASTRNGRFGPTVTTWFLDRARTYSNLDIDAIDLAELQLPDVLIDEGEPKPEPVVALGERIAAADAFAVVTPEYTHSFPAPLKTAIDWYLDEWQAKPVGFVSYGGMSGGLRAVEQLRLVFAEVGATTVRDVVSLHNYWDSFDGDGNWPKDPAGANTAAKSLLDHLTWWARALRQARTEHPLN
jgi:NAD(P)H-dependent FMN reductase